MRMGNPKLQLRLCPHGYQKKIVLSLQTRQRFGQGQKTLITNLNVRRDEQDNRGILGKSKNLSSERAASWGKHVRIQTIGNNRDREPVEKRVLR